MKLASTAAIATIAMGALPAAFGYGGTANLTFSWATSGTEKFWAADGSTAGGVSANTLVVMSDASYFSQQSGNSGMNYYNSDFASVAECNSLIAGLGTLTSTRKYGCRYEDFTGNPLFVNRLISDQGPGASATGTLTVTDTTLSGTLTIVSTTNEPSSGTATSVGDGASGYNLRQNDGSGFGSAWHGVTTVGTYTVNLTGTFTASSWQITGGSAKFSDSGFLCQQGGFSVPNNILCAGLSVPGGFTPTGGALSWGWELDGAASGLGDSTGEVEVRDPSNNIITTLSGVLASLSVDGAGNVTTNSGEVRRASRRYASGPCTSGSFITYDPTLQKISCGELIAADLVITGTAPTGPAGLFSRAGGQAYYDTVTNLTWVADANLAKTSGYDADGLMTWTGAQAWIATLNAASYLGKTDWRLPAITDTGSPGCNFAYTGTDCGYNMDLATGEMASMYYTTLGNDPGIDTSGTATACGLAVAPPYCLSNTGPFSNLQPNAYWSGTEFAPNTVSAWFFRFLSGYQDSLIKGNSIYAWAVRPGDIGPVSFADADGDGFADAIDNCPATVNPDQLNADGDARGDICDNCTAHANTDSGTVPNSPGMPKAQLDSDGDGYGNACDTDINNSGGTTATDFSILRSVIGKTYNFSANAAKSDINASGSVTATDFSILRARIGSPPGPSGLACAGTIPCPP